MITLLPDNQSNGGVAVTSDEDMVLAIVETAAAPVWTTPLSPAVDPVQPIWALIGKMLAVRNLLNPWWLDGGLGTPDTAKTVQLEQAIAAMIAQFHDGQLSDEMSFDALIGPLMAALGNHMTQLTAAAYVLDSQIQDLVLNQMAAAAGCSSYMPGRAMEGLVNYHANRGLYLEDAANGLRDYMLWFFRDSQGVPIVMPYKAVGHANILDSWINTTTTKTVVQDGRDLIASGGIVDGLQFVFDHWATPWSASFNKFLSLGVWKAQSGSVTYSLYDNGPIEGEPTAMWVVTASNYNGHLYEGSIMVGSPGHYYLSYTNPDFSSFPGPVTFAPVDSRFPSWTGGGPGTGP